MPRPGADTFIRLGKHHDHTSAVTATIVGTSIHATRALLSLHGFEPVGQQTMVMVRIDREEPYHAYEAAHALRAQGITVDIAPELLDDINTEWAWANYPMDWLTRDDIREVSNEAQTIYDDIRHGRLTIHLHGENHLRVISDIYDSPTQAIADFERLYGDAVRPGPAPATDTEQQAAQARLPTTTEEPTIAPTLSSEPTTPKAETVPVYAADPGDHEALLNDFLAPQEGWEKYRIWDDNTSIANHESLTLRALFDHEAEGRDIKWTLAAYETSVSDLLWHGTATASTPAEIVSTLLNSLATENAWGHGPSTNITETAIAEATRPLADAGWKHTIDGRYITWEAPGAETAGVQFDAFAAQQTNSPLPTWTVWGGYAVHQPSWALRLSAQAPAVLLQDITFELAEGNGLGRVGPTAPDGPALRTTQAPAPARVAAAPAALSSRANTLSPSPAPNAHGYPSPHLIKSSSEWGRSVSAGLG
ncbi:hypothetical protein SSP35_27_00090 [Streptomyces sp. NBRC 110611]|uniref:DUF317 domain-containing protein n=1 Tax=Streptomyces sp. NBRC 110611 TaxID=1621259 RepID=UPI00082D1A39|nr:DUF317 domain-containing protein [Streptomyces sp. NBRC 110611]GAU71088.1 hypothetical protein SSP35_27_00090 [Streptomyces sp. NBRC 110611]